MKTPKSKTIILAVPFLATAILFVAGCEEYGRHHKGNKGMCYERVLNIDKKTGQTHYEDRAVPCKK